MARDLRKLELSTTEHQIVREIFAPGSMHPYPDELQDSLTEWLDGVATQYLEAGRDVEVLEVIVPQLAALLDQILTSRANSLRAAAQDVHNNPPYSSEDRWPRLYLPVIDKVMRWAFSDCDASDL